MQSIGSVTLIVAGILPFINGIGAWLTVGPIMLGCSYDGCTPNTIWPFLLQMLFGVVVIGLGRMGLKGNTELYGFALALAGVELVMAAINIPAFYHFIPYPFYITFWINALLILVGAVVCSDSGMMIQQDIL